VITIEITRRDRLVALDAARLKSGVELVLSRAGVSRALVGLAVVGDDEIHELNRRYLGHDYPTDVLSFLLERCDDRLEGEIVLSAATAERAAADAGWSTDDELLLYAIHAALHLVGYDDLDPLDQAAMRAKEQEFLAEFGLSRRGP
jgi:probable rRNA maturation factor